VITGFRVAWGGAQTRLGVEPDLTCLGKVVGGGLPLAAYGGPRELMSRLAPEGPVYQAGTLSGNPLAVAAGLETLRHLRRPRAYERLEALSRRLTAGLAELAAARGIEFTADFAGGLFGFFFHPGPVRSFADARQASAGRYRAFFQEMLERGVYLAPSAFECGFVSLAHAPADVDATLEAARSAFDRAAEVP
jgi:glutamate-1-semialdehyde 2,1-aminomutase